MTQELDNKRWQDWTVLGIHALILVGVSLAIFIWRDQNTAGTVQFTDAAIIAGIGAIIYSFFTIATIVPSLQSLTPAIMAVGDLVLIGLYTNLVNGDPFFVVALLSLFAVVGMLRLGVGWGFLQLVGLLVVVIGVMTYRFTPDGLVDAAPAYVLPFLIALLVAVMAAGWVYARDRYSTSARLNQLASAKEKQLEDMRQRARTISEMTSALIGTTKFDRILEATLDIGQISLRKNAKRRLIGIVLLFRSYDEAMYIASSRGVRIVDQERVIYGKTGIVAEVLEECVPIIGENPSTDPELASLGIFKGIRSVLVIPLRAHYDNYGVIIFGSEEYDAFNEDHIDTLNAIGVQATVALQNAVLYKNLMEEKERIIEMEEDARKALVRDLHDIPTQTISAVAMRLRITMRQFEIDPNSVPAELQTIEEMSLRATEEIRHVLFKLRPLALESKGLGAALQELAEKMQKTYQQPMTVKVAADVERYLDDTQQGALFYLIEEATNNARKYANASMISVKIARQGEILVVRITDNGKGFDIDAANQNDKGSFGMINMRERAELLDGNLTIQSARGQGTTITVVVPLDLSRGDFRDEVVVPDQLPTTKLAAKARTWMDG